MKYKEQKNKSVYKFLKYLLSILLVLSLAFWGFYSFKNTSSSGLNSDPDKNPIPNKVYNSMINPEELEKLNKLRKRLPIIANNSYRSTNLVCEINLFDLVILFSTEQEQQSKQSFINYFIKQIELFINISHKYGSIHKYCINKVLFETIPKTMELSFTYLKISIEQLLGIETLGLYIKYLVLMDDLFKQFHNSFDIKNCLFGMYEEAFKFYRSQMIIVTRKLVFISDAILTFYFMSMKQSNTDDEQYMTQQALGNNGLLFSAFSNLHIFNILNSLFGTECVLDESKKIIDVNIKIRSIYRRLNTHTNLEIRKADISVAMMKYIDVLKKYSKQNSNDFNKDAFFKVIANINNSIMLDVINIFPRLESLKESRILEIRSS